MDTLTKAAEISRPARQILVLLGGGVSARSGIPAFRDRLIGFLGRQDPQRLETACNDHI